MFIHSLRRLSLYSLLGISLSLPPQAFAQDASSAPAPTLEDAATKAQAAWKDISEKLASNPLFKAFGLDKANFAAGESFSHSSSLNIWGSTFELSGKVSVDPTAAAGSPVATLDLTTTGPATHALSFGKLHATGAKASVSVTPSGSGYDFDVKIYPGFAGWTGDAPYFEMKEASGGVDYTLYGAGLSLSDFAPAAAALPAFGKYALTSIDENAGALTVAGTLGGKSLTVARAADGSVSVGAADITLEDLFPPLKNLPGIESIAIDALNLDGSNVEVQAKLNGGTVDVVSHAGNDSYVAVYFEDLEASAFVPAASGHAVDDLQLKNALFLVMGPKASPTTVTAADLPGKLSSLVGWESGEKLDLKPGINFAGTIDVSRSTSLSAALKVIGGSKGELPLRGTLAKNSFKGMAGAAKAKASSLGSSDVKSLLSGLDLKASLPIPTLPSIANAVTVSGPVTLELNGDAESSSGVWGKLPASLQHERPSGDLDFSATFKVVIKGGGTTEKLDAVVSLDEGSGGAGLAVLAVLDSPWKNPFGAEGFTFTDAGIMLALEKKTGETSEEIAFFATTSVGKSKPATVQVDLKHDSDGVSLQYFELDGVFKLSAFPGGSKIPHAEQFELDTVKITAHGVEAKTKLKGVQVDAFLFNSGDGQKPNWTFALDQKNFKITELVRAARKIKPLAAITIANAAVVISEHGLDGDVASHNVLAQDLFKDILGSSNVKLKIPAGIGVITEFDPAQMGDVGKGLSKIGVHNDAVIMGALEGVFSGTPSVDLELVMDAMGPTHGLPNKTMSVKAGPVPPSFFIKWSGEELDVGVKLDLIVKAGKDKLTLETDIDVTFTEEGLGLKLLGGLEGAWKNPMGVHGLELDNVKMDVVINDVGEVRFGFAGEEQFGDCSDKTSEKCADLDVAVEMSISLEDALPDGVAFKAEINHLDVEAIIDIAEVLLGMKSGGLNIDVPFFAVKNAKIAFATPGITDPDLGLVSEGFAFSGNFFFMNKHLGDIAASGGPTTGIALKGDIADIKLAILEFKKNDIDLAIGKKPHFILNSEIDLLGAQQIIKIDLEPPHFEFDLTEKLGVFGEADISIRLDGFDLTKGTFDSNADISVVGLFKSELVEWMEKQINKGIEELKNSATAKLEEGKRSLEGAQKKVDGLNAQIAKIKAEDDRAKSRAEAKLDSAKRRVASLKGTYDHEIHEAHHCGHWWSHWACSPGWYIAAGATWLVYEVAEGALDIAKGIVAAAFALDPRIAALVAARDIAHAALSIAIGVVEASEAVEKWVLNELEKIIDAALEHLPFEIQQAIIIGDLRDMVVHNKPMVFDLKFKIFGDQMREYFAVKIPDSAENIEFDITSFALLPAIALDKLIEDALKAISPAAAKWVHAHIGSKLAEAEGKVREQVQEEEKKYAKVLKTFETGGAKYRKAFQDHQEVIKKKAEKTQISDMMPASKQFKNTYLAIGHSRLCLAVSKDGLRVIQANCKDTAAERWSTAPLKAGYVQLKSKGLCLKARKGTKGQDYEPLILAPCNKKDKHEQWKIVTVDGYWDKIVNRYSQKCLHFNTENANPHSAYAVWTSCLGMDSQQFRDIPDAERPTWHNVNDFVKAKNGSCLAASENPRIVKLFDHWFGRSRGQRIVNAYEKLGWGMQVYSRKCGEKDERFNYLEMVNGDIMIRHAETGTCLYPSHRGKKLALRPCDTGSDMRWRVNAADGSFDQLYNPYRKKCMVLPAPGKAKQKEAVMGSCSKNDATLVDFVR